MQTLPSVAGPLAGAESVGTLRSRGRISEILNKLDEGIDAMNNIIVPLYHMQCHLAEVRIVHEGQFVSRIF